MNQTQREREGDGQKDKRAKRGSVKIYKDVQNDEEVEKGEMKSEMEQTNRECEEQVRWQ